MKRLVGIGVLCLALITVGNINGRVGAQSINHYLILASGQGAGSTSFAQAVSSANATVTNVMDDIGVVTADPVRVWKAFLLGRPGFRIASNI